MSGHPWVRDHRVDLRKVAVWAEFGAPRFGSCQDPPHGHNHMIGAQEGPAIGPSRPRAVAFFSDSRQYHLDMLRRSYDPMSHTCTVRIFVYDICIHMYICIYHLNCYDPNERMNECPPMCVRFATLRWTGLHLAPLPETDQVHSHNTNFLLTTKRFSSNSIRLLIPQRSCRSRWCLGRRLKRHPGSKVLLFWTLEDGERFHIYQHEIFTHELWY